jgi:hypothetical protein
VPQFWFELVGVSQPSAKMPLQSPQPGSQDPTLHDPALQPGVPFTIGSTFWFIAQRVASPVPQTQPQVPQLVGSCFTSASQPSLAIPLQSAVSPIQPPIAQVPLSEQAEVAFGKSQGEHPGTRQPTLGSVSDTHRALQAFVPAGHVPSMNLSTFVDSEHEATDPRQPRDMQAAAHRPSQRPVREMFP